MKTIDEALALNAPDGVLKAIRETIEEKLAANLPLTIGEEEVWNVHSFIVEAYNGGINQYLWNPIGHRAMHTLQALERIGARHTYSILLQITRTFPGGIVPIEQPVRHNALESIEAHHGDLFDKADEELFATPDDFRDLIYRYIKNNTERFRT